MIVPMSHLGLVTVVVDDARAIAHDVDDLGFSLVDDIDQGRVAVFRDLFGNRWDLLQTASVGMGVPEEDLHA